MPQHSVAVFLGVSSMKKIDTIRSITDKPLGEIYATNNLFAFKHLVADEFQNGFQNWNDAYDAFITFHNDWFENQ
jgi:hypothetical protein